jgi:uncharacterized damage-inducible protein DinB
LKVSHPIAEYLEKALDATVEVARAFPADKYDFWPAPKSMAVGEQIEHLADNLKYMIEPIAAQAAIARAPEAPADDPLSRLERVTARIGEVLAHLPEDAWQQTMSYPGDFTMTPARAALVMLEHDAHHRGQLIVALRLLGIDPPRRWKEE